MTGKRDERLPITPEGLAALAKNPVEALMPIVEDMARDLGLEIDRGAMDRAASYCDEPFIVVRPIENRGPKPEPDGQSSLPRFNRYSIPHKARPGEVACPYCVKRPLGARGLRDHCRAQHPDKPEAR